MTTKQLAIMIGVTVVLSLVIAWTIEQAQVRSFMKEFEKWYGGKEDGQQSTGS